MYCIETFRCALCILLVTFSLATDSDLLDKMVKDYIEIDGESQRRTGRIDMVYPSVETFRSGIKRITFRALDQDIELRLEPAGDVIADDFTIIHGENGEIDHSVDIQSLKLKLYKDAEMGASLHIDEDGPLTIYGIINSKLQIEPETSEKRDKNGRIAHRVIEVLRDENFRCGVKTISVPSNLTTSFKYTDSLSDDEYLKIEYLFVAESNFTEMFKNYEVTMEIYLAIVMNKVLTIFDTLELGIKVRIIGIIKLTTENEAKLAPYIPSYKRGIAAYETLSNMGKFYCESTDPLDVRADIIILITRRPLGGYDENGLFSSYIEGVAYLGTVCNMCYKCAIVKDHSSLDERANTIAHESAHLLGCNHDGDGDEITGSKDCPASDGYILGHYGNDKNWLTFSPCCKRAVEYMLTNQKASCIIDSY